MSFPKIYKLQKFISQGLFETLEKLFDIAEI